MIDENIKKRIKYTEEKIKALRDRLSKTLKGSDFAVVTSGSFARGEASGQSDLDFFIICDDDNVKKELQHIFSKIQNCIQLLKLKAPADDGAFAETESIKSMVTNIGGQKDQNNKITRRILFLLEGQWLFGPKQFESYRRKIVHRYIKQGISDHQLSKFFLNDLIRYYRTMCVDFEYKTAEDGKPWGTRNLKLMFSRKLLYFSGIIVAAESAQRSYETKINRTLELLSLTPIARIQEVCGSRADIALQMYGRFLKALSDPEVRKLTDAVTNNRDTHTQEFKALKNEGHHFTWALAKLLKDTYDTGHPIHNALIL